MAQLPFSPSSLEGYRDSPITTLLNRFVFKKGDPVVKYSESMVGTELHQYASDAFKYLESKKKDFPSNPSESFIKNTLIEAQEKAKSSLTLHTSRHMKKGMDSIINRYGSEYVKDKNMMMFSETTMAHTVTNGITGETGQLTGIPDVVFYDQANKKASIIDLKNVFDREKMTAFDKADKKLQSKAYPFLVMQELTKKGLPLDSVEFTFAMNPAYGPVGYQSFEFTAKQIMANMQTELAIETANAENKNRMITRRVGQGESPIEAFRGAYAEIINSRGCTPGAGCFTCPMQYSCHMRFAQQIGEKMQSYDDPVANLSKRDQIRQKLQKEGGSIYQDFLDFENAEKMDKGDIDFFMNKHDNAMSEALSRFEEKQYTMYQEAGKYPVAAKGKAARDAAVLKQSMLVERRFKRGQFENSYLDDSTGQRGKLPFSMLDYDSRAPHTWMSGNLLRAVRSISYDAVDSTLKNMDINRPEMTERVINRLFSDKQFVTQFNENLQWNAASQMKERGLTPTYGNARDVLTNVGKMLDDNTVNHLMDNLHRETIDEVWRNDAESLRRKLPADVEFKRSNYDAVFNAAKSKGIINDNPETVRRKISDMDTAWGKQERFSLSAPRNIMSTMVKAFVLTQIAGNETILNILQNKMSKAVDFMASNETKTDTGEHNSTYSTMRRIILSDFGSSTRKFGGVSGAYSYIASKGSSALKAVKERAADYFMKSESSIINQDFLATGGDNYIYGGVAAAAGLAFYTLVPRSPSETESKKTGLAKRESLKKKREVKRSKDSSYQNPQSALREKYKVHGQFGSPFLDKVGLMLEKIDLTKVGEYLGKIADGSLALAKDLYSHPVERVASMKLLGERVKNLSFDILDNPVDVLKKAGREIGNAASETEQYITQKKVMVYGKERVSELKKTMDAGLAKENLSRSVEKIGQKIGPDTITSTAISVATKSKPNPHAVIVEKDKNRKTYQPVYSRQETGNSDIYPVSRYRAKGDQQYIEASVKRLKQDDRMVLTRSMGGDNYTGDSTISQVMSDQLSGKLNVQQAFIGKTVSPVDMISPDKYSRPNRTVVPETPEYGRNSQPVDRATYINQKIMSMPARRNRYGGQYDPSEMLK